MARNNNRRRDTSRITNHPVARKQDYQHNVSPSYIPTRNWIRPNPVLTYYEDRRQWHPEGAYRPARSFSQPRHRLTIVEPRRASQPYSSWRSPYLRSNFSLTQRVAFQKPEKVLVCVRRQQRREVLFARKKTGRGAGRRSKPRFNFYSSISCRR